jgi:transcriptional regulator with XRE-family HTH domain
MVAAHGDPPAVARQRVRRALRKARVRTPWSQGEVAKKLGWSLSKMQRIEGGEVAVSVTDLRALLDIYRVTDPGEVERLAHDARISRRQRYLTPAEHRQHLSSAFLQLMQFEREAVSIRSYQSVTYPGVLQTPAVAEALLAWTGKVLSDDDRRVRFEVRMERRRRIIEEAGGAEYFLVLDEAVLRRQVGTRDVTAGQLEYLADVALRDTIHIRVMPFQASAYVPAISPFQLIDLGGDGDDFVLYTEEYLSDQMVYDQDRIGHYRDAFKERWRSSLDEEKSRRMIVAEAAALRAHGDDLG